MRGRYDLTQHFFVSAALATMAGPAAAEAVGLAKELRDSQGDSGFSFSDVCADLAGIALAQRLSDGKTSLADLQKFRVAEHLPELDDLADGLSSAEFARQYGSLLDPRFQRQVEAIRQRVAALSAPR
jgi:hypothetical protein